MTNSEKEKACEIYRKFTKRSSKDDEYNDWAGYRKQLTDFVLNNVRPGSTLLITGAGKCSDLDIKRLSEHCGSVILSDYRTETMKEAVERYGLSGSEKVLLSESDYVGITDEDYLKYTGLLLVVMEKLSGNAGNSLEETAGSELENLFDELERIYEDNEDYIVDLGGISCDSVATVGVHSQLNNSFRGIFQYVRKDIEDRGKEIKYLEELNKAIFERTGKHTSYLVRRLNKAVFSAAKEGVIYGYEKSMIYTPEGETSPVIGTVDGARQAGEEIESFHRTDQLRCLWPLSKRRGIKFEMDICYLDMKKI